MSVGLCHMCGFYRRMGVKCPWKTLLTSLENVWMIILYLIQCKWEKIAGLCHMYGFYGRMFVKCLCPECLIQATFQDK